MIDLHTHTTASDGRSSPVDLVARASAAGVTVLSVTDHDTVAGCDPARAACLEAGIEFVPGIEITSMRDGVDLHVLGYFLDTASPSLLVFLDRQRQQRIDRVRQMVGKLATLGLLLDGDAIVQPALDDRTRSAGRPWIARALVAAGLVASTSDAFALWLGTGKPAYVPRSGPTPEDVFERIHEARGVASLAHPGLVGHDDWIEDLVGAGVDALEAYHSEHDPTATARYIALAARLEVAVTGGSDYHGDAAHGADRPGSTSLPREAYERLVRLQPDADRL